MLGDHLPNATSDRHFLHQRPDFPVFSDQKQGKALLCPHIYCQNSHHSACLRENHRMRPPLAPDWRELSLRRSNVCVPQCSQLFNRASKNWSVSGKPCLRDHLSITTIFPCTVGWSLKTGFTVRQKVMVGKYCPLSVQQELQANMMSKEVLKARIREVEAKEQQVGPAWSENIVSPCMRACACAHVCVLGSLIEDPFSGESNVTICDQDFSGFWFTRGNFCWVWGHRWAKAKVQWSNQNLETCCSQFL